MLGEDRLDTTTRSLLGHLPPSPLRATLPHGSHREFPKHTSPLLETPLYGSPWPSDEVQLVYLSPEALPGQSTPTCPSSLFDSSLPLIPRVPKNSPSFLKSTQSLCTFCSPSPPLSEPAQESPPPGSPPCLHLAEVALPHWISLQRPKPPGWCLSTQFCSHWTESISGGTHKLALTGTWYMNERRPELARSSVST